jgi:hypothetical protein
VDRPAAQLVTTPKTITPQSDLMTKQSRGTRRLSSRETDVFGAARRPRYVPRIIEKVEAAGFKLQAKSEVNANPKDTKDYPDGVWTLPPTFRLGEKDKDEVRRDRRERSHDAAVREEVGEVALRRPTRSRAATSYSVRLLSLT